MIVIVVLLWVIGVTAFAIFATWLVSKVAVGVHDVWVRWRFGRVLKRTHTPAGILLQDPSVNRKSSGPDPV
jgi:hypothetical protein